MNSLAKTEAPDPIIPPGVCAYGVLAETMCVTLTPSLRDFFRPKRQMTTKLDSMDMYTCIMSAVILVLYHIIDNNADASCI